MIVPQFLRFYQGYTAESVLSEYAIRFFALLNSMFRLEAEEKISTAVLVSAGVNGNDEVIENLKKQSRGLHGILNEVKTAKAHRNV